MTFDCSSSCSLHFYYFYQPLSADKVPNKNKKMSSFKSSENIQKEKGGPDKSVSNNQSSSVTLNELAIKAKKDTVTSSFSKEVIH